MRFCTGVMVTVLAIGVLAVAGCNAAPATLPGTGAWRVAYTGYGHVRASNGRDDHSFFLEPARPASVTSTHSALVLSTRSWHDFVLEVRVRTTRQLRRPRPNDWEVGWLLWHYTDERHFYYLILKPNGFELGKEDPTYAGQQRFLVTSNEPRFPVRRWYVIRVVQRGDVISVGVNGRSLLRYSDAHDPYRSGLVGLYTEDAAVAYQIVGLKPAP